MMHLLTYGDNPDLIKYIKSPYINIGFGQPFVDMFSKLEAMGIWFRHTPPADDDIIVFVDGYDVVQRRVDLENFEKEFLKFESDIVLSAEAYCWPSPWMSHLFPPSPTKYRWPNSGTFVGRAWAIKKMLDFGPYRLAFDDQGYVHDFFLRQNDVKILLDYKQVLFQTGAFVDWSEIDATNAWFIHFNGKSHRMKNGGSVLAECASGRPIGGISKLKLNS